MSLEVNHRLGVVLVALGVTLGSANCALTSKAEMVEIRYFSPERIQTPPARDAQAPATAPEVRLGRVSSGSNLRERIVHRDSAYEVGYYENLRWTERPEAYVRRELGRSLFEMHGLRRAQNRSAPTLDVEVVAFDDLRSNAGRTARVQLNVLLYSETAVLFEDTVTVDHPVTESGPPIEPLVAAMATALEAAANEITAKVQGALREKSPATVAASEP